MKKYLILVFIISIFSISYADRLEDIKKRGYIKAGVKYDYKPFGFKKGSKVVGFDIDLLIEVAKRMKLKIMFQQVTSKTRVPLVVANSIDIAAASMTHTRNRDDKMDFTISYFFDGQTLLVRKNGFVDNTKNYLSKKVGVIQGSTSEITIKKLYPNTNLVYFHDYEKALLALESNKIDAITTDYTWCKEKEIDYPNKFKVLSQKFSFEPYGMGVPENESNFRDEINFMLQDIVLDGTYDKIYFKWFNEKPSRIPEIWGR